MTTLSGAAVGTVAIGDDLVVNRLGYGALRITGKGIWGEPSDRAECLRVLRRLPELGVDFIDTADSYGPFVSEELIREALHPYRDMVIATKGGLTRQGPDIWRPVGRPEYLRQCVLMSMRRLGVERIDLWQLHRIDNKVPRDEQFDAIADMQREGLIRHVGLSEVNVEEVEAARKFFPVVSVQNLYNLVTRKYEDVLDFCERAGIAFIPWFPLAAGGLAGEGNALSDVARRLGATPAQVALAWVLKRSRLMLPFPGTS
jgi:aryl-alcohol dehydrogenase-like predicted oxidoreductase